jgi:hypothetical protein
MKQCGSLAELKTVLIKIKKSKRRIIFLKIFFDFLIKIIKKKSF